MYLSVPKIKYGLVDDALSMQQYVYGILVSFVYRVKLFVGNFKQGLAIPEPAMNLPLKSLSLKRCTLVC